MYDDEYLCAACGRTLAQQEIADGEAVCTLCRMKATTPRHTEDEVAQAIRHLMGDKESGR